MQVFPGYPFLVTMIEHISTLCSKAAMQVNALNRLQKYMGKTEEML